MEDSEATKDKSQLKRPPNAFLIFCKQNRAAVFKKYYHLDNRSVTRMLGQLWADLQPDDKSIYINQAKEYRDSFMKANPDYKWYNPDKHSHAPGNRPSTRPSNAYPVSHGERPQHLDQNKPAKLTDSTGIGGLNLLLKAGQHTMASSPVANHETLSTETGTIGSQQTKSPHLQSKSKRYPNETTDTRLSPTASVSQDPVSRSTCNKTKTDMSPFIHQQKATGSQNWSNCSQYPMKSCVNCQLCSRGDPLSSEGHSVPLRDAASHQVFSEVNEQAMVAGTSKAQTETAPAEDHSNSNTALLQLALMCSNELHIGKEEVPIQKSQSKIHQLSNLQVMSEVGNPLHIIPVSKRMSQQVTPLVSMHHSYVEKSQDIDNLHKNLSPKSRNNSHNLKDDRCSWSAPSQETTQGCNLKKNIDFNQRSCTKHVTNCSKELNHEFLASGGFRMRRETPILERVLKGESTDPKHYRDFPCSPLHRKRSSEHDIACDIKRESNPGGGEQKRSEKLTTMTGNKRTKKTSISENIHQTYNHTTCLDTRPSEGHTMQTCHQKYSGEDTPVSQCNVDANQVEDIADLNSRQDAFDGIRKSQRSNRGNRYKQMMSEGIIHSNKDRTSQRKSSLTAETKTESSTLDMTSMPDHRKRRRCNSEQTHHHSISSEILRPSDFTGKKCEENTKTTENLEQKTVANKRKIEKTAALVGSQKRKARRFCITHLISIKPEMLDNVQGSMTTPFPRCIPLSLFSNSVTTGNQREQI